MLNEKILEAIKETLPANTALQMKQFIEEAEANKQSLKTKDQTIEIKNLRITSLETLVKDKDTKIAELTDRVLRNDQLEAKAKELETKENKLLVTMLELELKLERMRREGIEDLTRIVFRNKETTFKESSMVPVARTTYTSVYDNSIGQYRNEPAGDYVESHEQIKTTIVG